MPPALPTDPIAGLLAYGVWISLGASGTVVALIAVATRLRWRDAARRRDLAARP